MNIKDLIIALQDFDKTTPTGRDLDVVIPVYQYGALGGTPSVDITLIHGGFDWDAGKLFLTSEDELMIKPSYQLDKDKLISDTAHKIAQQYHRADKAKFAAGIAKNLHLSNADLRKWLEEYLLNFKKS